MSKPKAQGTAWETAFVNACQDIGLAADRMPEGGMNDAGDVWVGDTPSRSVGATDMSILAWKRLVNTGSQRRGPDGIGVVIVMGVDDFWTLARLATRQGFAFVVECKATERLNVTRELFNAKLKLLRWKRGKVA